MTVSSSGRFNICSGCSKGEPHRDGSFEYPQHMFDYNSLKDIDILLIE